MWKGDLAFVPAGKEYELSCEGKVLCLTLQINTFSWKDVQEKLFKKVKTEYEEPLPRDFLFPKNEQSIQESYEKFVAHLSK